MRAILEAGPQSPAFATLVFSLACAFLYVFMTEQAPSVRRTGVKTLSVTLLGILVVLLHGPWLAAAALFLSAFGDALLAQEDRRDAFLLGIAAFFAAHGAFAALFIGAADLELMGHAPWRIAVGAGMVVVAAMATMRLLPRTGALRLPVLLYSVAILAMALSTLLVPRPMLVLGAVLFMISDLMVAERAFPARGGQTETPTLPAWFGPVAWITYYAAQAILTLGILGLL